MSSTKDIVDNHLKSFGEGDLNGILSDYAPMAILFTPDGPLEGVDAIRALFEGLLAEFAKPGSLFELKHLGLRRVLRARGRHSAAPLALGFWNRIR